MKTAMALESEAPQRVTPVSLRSSQRPARPATEDDVLGALDDILELSAITHPSGAHEPVSSARAKEVVERIDRRAAHRSGSIRAVKS